MTNPATPRGSGSKSMALGEKDPRSRRNAQGDGGERFAPPLAVDKTGRVAFDARAMPRPLGADATLDETIAAYNGLLAYLGGT